MAKFPSVESVVLILKLIEFIPPNGLCVAKTARNRFSNWQAPFLATPWNFIPYLTYKMDSVHLQWMILHVHYLFFVNYRLRNLRQRNSIRSQAEAKICFYYLKCCIDRSKRTTFYTTFHTNKEMNFRGDVRKVSKGSIGHIKLHWKIGWVSIFFMKCCNNTEKRVQRLRDSGLSFTSICIEFHYSLKFGFFLEFLHMKNEKKLFCCCLIYRIRLPIWIVLKREFWQCNRILIDYFMKAPILFKFMSF